MKTKKTSLMVHGSTIFLALRQTVDGWECKAADDQPVSLPGYLHAAYGLGETEQQAISAWRGNAEANAEAVPGYFDR